MIYSSFRQVPMISMKRSENCYLERQKKCIIKYVMDYRNLRVVKAENLSANRRIADLFSYNISMLSSARRQKRATWKQNQVKTCLIIPRIQLLVSQDHACKMLHRRKIKARMLMPII